ncbi:fungal-specific transcription factor domain-containing protein [Cercophora scortea]|uniref:Fungal-specific transcription factor domain-containing protein n=1 Tax=Cercophora scortea TaxID=314031 RepID=A0AAE0I2N3_9PEZI|nr:fungal-specific transcription factor domain-containing protein [Cercophora scortea]
METFDRLQQQNGIMADLSGWEGLVIRRSYRWFHQRAGHAAPLYWLALTRRCETEEVVRAVWEQYNKLAFETCDLCFTKKIKCDMLKPVCSNCRQYHTECKTTAVRRRAGQNARKPTALAAAAVNVNMAAADVSPSVSAGQLNESDRLAGLENRLARMEEQLQHVLLVATAAINANSKVSHAASGTAPASLPNIASQNDTRELDTFLRFEDETELISDELDPITRHPALKLPPLDHILPIVEAYFTHFNPVIPLFSQVPFMRMLNAFYSSPSSNNSHAEWAAINTVLALGSRLPFQEASSETHDSTRFMDNAQSALTHLVTRDEDLLGLQVLLGLVLLYQDTKDPRPATVLIGAAVRLTHRLRLQSRNDIQALYPAAEGLHRSRLFWITYMLDKEISLRHQTPSVQLDADIDLDLPDPSPADGVGDIYTLEGRVRVSYLRLRVQLAYIMGKGYDLLYSTRSSKVSAQERRDRVVRLSRQLEIWRGHIPGEMQLRTAADNLGRMELVFMATLHCGYLSCLVMVHGVWSSNAQWIQRVSRYGQVVIKDSEFDGRRVCSSQMPPLPVAWKRCVQISRECLAMARRMPQSDYSVWNNACAFFSAMIIILANMYEFPDDECTAADRELTGYALEFFKTFKDASVLIPFQQLHMVVVEMHGRASMAVEAAAHSRQREAIASSESEDRFSIDALAHDVVQWPDELDPSFPYLGRPSVTDGLDRGVGDGDIAGGLFEDWMTVV